MSTPDHPPTHEPAAKSPDDASLVKIREIIVGPTTRAIDQRLEGFRKQIDTVIQQSEQETASRLTALDKQLRDGLDLQLSKSGGALEQAQRSIDSKIEELRRQTRAISENVSKVQAEIQERLDREFETVREDLCHQVASLRVELVDRQTMASLFSEMSLRVGCAMEGHSVDPSPPEVDLETLIDQRTSR